MTGGRLIGPGVLAMLLQAGALFFAWLAARGAYGTTVGEATTTEASASHSLIAALVVSSVGAGFFALRGLYRLHAHRGLAASLVGTVLFYVPPLTVAVTSVWILLVILRLY